MKFYNFCSQIFVHKNNGQIWNFHISNNSLFYRIIIDNKPIKKIKLMDNIRTYDVSIDTSGNIDLVCVKNNNELIYFNCSNNSWKRKTFKKTNSKSDINFVNILNIKNSIHIFYSFRNTSENKPYKVFHIHSYDNQWKYNYLAPIMISKNTKPYLVDYNKYGEILFLYKFNANTKNRGNIYAKAFSTKKNRWSSAVNLKFKGKNVRILNLLIDSKDKVHFVFKENTSVKYLCQQFYGFNNMVGTLQLKNQISLGDMGEAYQIFEIDDSLLISWKKNNKLFQLSPEKQADSPIEKELTNSNDIFNIKYLGAHYRNKSISKALLTFGTKRSNQTLLLGLDNDFFDKEEVEFSEESTQMDRSWYGGDQEVLDPIDEILTEEDKEEDKIENDAFAKYETNNTESDTEPEVKESDFQVDNDLPDVADSLLVENETEKDPTINKEEIDTKVEITEATSNLADEFHEINDISTAKEEVENDIDTHSEEINLENDVVEPEPSIHDEFLEDEESNDIDIPNNIEEQSILATDIGSSEKVDEVIVEEETKEEVKTSDKKSIFKRMKDYLTNN